MPDCSDRSVRMQHLDTILDCMTGADGGASFCKLRNLLQELEKRENRGDTEARKVLDVVSQFAKLIEYANTL